MSSIDMTKVLFTNHALKKFRERFKSTFPKDNLSNPEQTARKLLSKAREDNTLDDVSRVKRLINNNFQEVEYFSKNGWRFVVKDNGTQLIVLTIERQDG